MPNVNVRGCGVFVAERLLALGSFSFLFESNQKAAAMVAICV
jgi:hypothetical protein